MSEVSPSSDTVAETPANDAEKPDSRLESAQDIPLSSAPKSTANEPPAPLFDELGHLKSQFASQQQETAATRDAYTGIQAAFEQVKTRLEAANAKLAELGHALF